MFETRNNYRDADSGDVAEGLFKRSDVRIVQFNNKELEKMMEREDLKE